ncbi:MAG TPA: ribonuclease R [Candidatus Polarisedimenticolia bacterium]|nr:ribonuclease R [Candidatus Polarisedimenticolia bacterium]
MNDARHLRDAILDFMRRPNYRPVSADELQRLLRIDRSRRHPFSRALRALVNDDAVIRVDRHRYAIAGWTPTVPRSGGRDGRGDGGRRVERRDGGRHGRTAEPRVRDVPAQGAAAPAAGPMRAGSIVTGNIQVHPKGFAFVTPDRGGVDLFIPPPAVGDTQDGDRVEAIVVRMQADGRATGDIRRVLEKTRRRIVGVYRGGPDGGTVEAYDRRFEAGIAIPREGVGGAVNGLVVGVEVEQQAEEGRSAWGRIVEVIGPAESPETDLKAVIRKFGLRQEFPPDVMQQAAQAPDRVPPEDIRGREDFRDLPIVTIDGETAMDFDDAVLVRRLDGGHYELHVHIADVAHYVRGSSPLDREALERATSVYFPGTSLPMLPHRLSNGICSLNPHVDRLVLSCVMTIDPQGQVTQYRLAEGVIRSAARMTYTNVAKILVDRDPRVMTQYRDFVAGFRLMEELCGVLNARRRRRGSIDFDLPEPEVILAATGEMTGIMALERNIAHRLIEEFMLTANETVARHLFRAKVPSMYRVHERPDPRRLEDFEAVAHAFGYSLPRPFTSIEPRSFQSLLERARGRPEERFLSRLMLRSMKQARYSEKRDIHFGLASTCYTHFTSPIRRYPDLVVHRLVKRLLKGGPVQARERGDLEVFMPEAAARSSVRERTADAAENELIERKKMVFMAQKIGEEFDGFICGVEAFGIFVELQELFVDGLVGIDALPGDRFRFIERQRIMKGERHGQVLALGDPVRVRLSRVSAARMEIEFALLEHRPGPRPAGVAAAVREPAETRAGRRDVARGKRRQDERKRAAASGAAAPGRGHAPARHGRRGRTRGGGGSTGAGSVRSGRGRRRR